jgi:hypothetical protein
MQALPLQTRNIDHTGDTNFDIVELRNDLQANVTDNLFRVNQDAPLAFCKQGQLR